MDRSRRRWSLPRFAVEHPHFTWILALVLAGAGFAAYLSTPQRMVPKVPHPNIGVVTHFPGMSAVDMQRYITAPLEKQIQLVGGIRYMLGTSRGDRDREQWLGTDPEGAQAPPVCDYAR